MTEKIKKMLRCDNNYHLFASLDNGKVVGISLMYTFKELGFGSLDYIAVIPVYQNKEISTELFKFTLQEFKSDAPNGIGLLMEIQKVNVRDQLERNKRIRRVNFYKRLGVKILEGVMIAVILTILLFKKKIYFQAYRELDSSYMEVQKIGIDHPFLLRKRYWEMDREEQKIYGQYALIIWNICETAYDRNKVDKTWYQILNKQRIFHLDWLKRKENSKYF